MEDRRRVTTATAGFEELTEAVSTALLRAVSSRPAGKGTGLDGRIIAGVWIEPQLPVPGVPTPEPEPWIRLSRSELGTLATGDPISRRSLAALNEALSTNRSLATKFLASLGEDPSGTLDRLFELTDDERRALEVSAREDRDLLRDLPRFLGALGDRLTTVSVEAERTTIAKAKEKEKEDKFKWELSLSPKVGEDKDGNTVWEVGATIKVTF